VLRDALIEYDKDPTASWADIARRCGSSEFLVRRLVGQAQRAIDPTWRKPRGRSPALCARCGVEFQTVRGYEGDSARYCLEHRHHSMHGKQVIVEIDQTCAGCGVMFNAGRRQRFHDDECRLSNMDKRSQPTGGRRVPANFKMREGGSSN